MSGEIRQITITVTTRDPQHWNPESLAAAEAKPDSFYSDWAIDGLLDAVQAAANRYVAEHPDLFATDPDVS